MSTVGTRTVITPRGSLTYQNQQELEAVFQKCFEQRKTEVILDCKSVPFIDSEVLEYLLNIHNDLRNSGGVLILVGLDAVCRDILRATRLMNVFNVYRNIQESAVG